MRTRRRPIPPAIGEANAWLITIRRPPSACSSEKTAPFGSRPIDRPRRLAIRSSPKSSTCGVVRTAVGEPGMASSSTPRLSRSSSPRRATKRDLQMRIRLRRRSASQPLHALGTTGSRRNAPQTSVASNASFGKMSQPTTMIEAGVSPPSPPLPTRRRGPIRRRPRREPKDDATGFHAVQSNSARRRHPPGANRRRGAAARRKLGGAARHARHGGDLSGRAEFIEKYYETIRDLLDRGLSVAIFDWRGQGGSARQLKNPRKGHIDDFSLYERDFSAFVSRGARDLLSASRGSASPIRWARRSRWRSRAPAAARSTDWCCRRR